jgi:hypothetical protein
MPQMISTPGAVPKLLTGLIAMLPLLLLARPCLANEPTTINTMGFSVTFGEKWHVSTDHNGTILGSIRGEVPPLIIIYYADELMTNDRAKGNMFAHMKRSAIADIMGDSGSRMVDKSKWHRHETVHRLDGINEEQLDFDIDLKDKDNKEVEVCSFIRLYHDAPHAELYVAFTVDKSCDDARDEFHTFETSIVWK